MITSGVGVRAEWRLSMQHTKCTPNLVIDGCTTFDFTTLYMLHVISYLRINMHIHQDGCHVQNML